MIVRSPSLRNSSTSSGVSSCRVSPRNRTPLRVMSAGHERKATEVADVFGARQRQEPGVGHGFDIRGRAARPADGRATGS